MSRMRGRPPDKKNGRGGELDAPTASREKTKTKQSYPSAAVPAIPPDDLRAAVLRLRDEFAGVLERETPRYAAALRHFSAEQLIGLFRQKLQAHRLGRAS